MKSGIYKWESPTNRVYIGMSKDINKRLQWYKSNAIYSSSMTRLKRSFKKYGVENHKFEVLEYCSLSKLNEREIYWGVLYKVLGSKGLNCALGNQNVVFSKITKNKMSKAKKGIPQTPETIEKRKNALQPYWDELSRKKKEKKNNKPKYIFTEEHKNNLSISKKGKPIHTEESKKTLSNIGKKRTWLSKMRKARQYTPVGQYDLKDNLIKVWKSASEAEKKLNGGKSRDNIGACIRGKQKTAYGYKWKILEKEN